MGVSVPLVTFFTSPGAGDPAAPCVTTMVVVPPTPGIDAVMLPAGGGGGAIVLRLVKLAANGAGSARPNGSLMLVATFSVYAVFGASGCVERNVTSRFPDENSILPATTPVDELSWTLAAVTVDGSTGAEKVTTTALVNETLWVPFAGVTVVTVGGRAFNAKSSATT